MYNVEALKTSGEFVQLRSGLTSKETYRSGDKVLSVIDVSRLASQDKNPLKMRDFIEDYISELKKAGIPVVEIFEIILQGDTIIITTKYHDVFLDAQMALGDEQFISGVNGILNALCLIKNCPVGIDPTPKNFAVTEIGIMYADFFYSFCRSYSEWVRSRMDPENPQHRYISIVHDYVYNPLVYAHALADFNQLNIFPPDKTMDLVANHCFYHAPGFDLEYEYNRYLEVKKLAREEMNNYLR